MSRHLYQIKAEPIEVISNAAEAQPIVNWEPHAEVSKRRPPAQAWQRATYTSGHADPSWFLLPVSVQGVGWLVQNATPRQIHTKKKFHPSLLPCAPDPVWINTWSIQPFGIESTASVGIPTVLPVTSYEASSGAVSTDGTGLVVTWISGDVFSQSMVGQVIVINGVSSTVASVESPTSLTLATAVGLSLTGVGYSILTPADSHLYVGGTEFDWLESTFRIDKDLSGAWTASFDFIYTAGVRVGAVRSPVDLPEPGDEVIFYWRGMRRFGGLVQSIEESEIKGRFDCSLVSVKCTGYQALTDRAVVAKLYTVPIGGIASIIIFDLWEKHLQQFGTTFQYFEDGDPFVVLGEQEFHYITITEALNLIVNQTPGWGWWIDDNNQLRFRRTSGAGLAAPFSLTNGSLNVDSMRVTRSNSRFRNRQWVLPSGDLVALWTDDDTGDGTTIAFPTLYVQNEAPRVVVNGVDQVVTSLGNWISGWQCYYIPGGIGIFFATAPGNGLAIGISYRSTLPLAFSAEDADSIAERGLYEAVRHAQNVPDRETAEAEAAGLLEIYAQDGNFPEAIEFEYNSENQREWLLPGMLLSVNRTFPTASGNYMVEQVTSVEQDLTLWRHTVRLRKGPGEVSDAQAIEEFRRSTRVAITARPDRATWEIGTDIPGITNPGLSTGLLSNRYTFETDGILSGWDALFEIDPPTGADLIIDFLLNGVSIFPSGDANKIVVPAGITTLVNGFRFTADNLPYSAGDVLTMNIIQVGSINKGKNGVVHLNTKPRVG